MKWYGYLFAAVAVLLMPGCRSIGEKESEAAAELRAERQLGEKMLEAFKADRADEFLRALPPGALRNYGKKEFKADRDRLLSSIGKPMTFRYLGKLEMEPVHQHVWAVRFQRPSPNAQGTGVYQEMMFRTVVGRVDGRLMVFEFRFL